MQQPPHFPGEAVDRSAILGRSVRSDLMSRFGLRFGVWKDTADVMKLSSQSSRATANSSPEPMDPDSVLSGRRPTGSVLLGYEWAHSFRTDVRVLGIVAARVSNAPRGSSSIRISGLRLALSKSGLGRSEIDIRTGV